MSLCSADSGHVGVSNGWCGVLGDYIKKTPKVFSAKIGSALC